MKICRLHQDVYIGIVCLASCAFFWALNSSLPTSPAMMPRILVCVLAVLSVMIIQQGLRRSSHSADGQDKPLTWDSLKIPLVTWGLTSVYAILFYLIGYFAATAVMLIVLMRFMKRTSWPVILTIDGVYILIMYCVFVKMLEVHIDNLGLLGSLL